MDICCLKYFTIRRDGGTTLKPEKWKIKNKKIPIHKIKHNNFP
jgi:hypothetical protein